MERRAIAETCALKLELTLPILIDNMENTVCIAYCAWPDRIYIVGKDGKIKYAGAQGPKGFSVTELEDELSSLFPR